MRTFLDLLTFLYQAARHIHRIENQRQDGEGGQIEDTKQRNGGPVVAIMSAETGTTKPEAVAVASGDAGNAAEH